MTKSTPAWTTEREIATGSSSEVGKPLNSLVIPGLPPPTDGNALRILSEMPAELTPAQEQLLLGTMLGDGCMTTAGAKNPRYRSQHGWVQHAYNFHKYLALSAFVRTPPKRAKNGGYGEFRSCWATVTSPALWPIACTCLHEGKKRVTRGWLDWLTWEGIAWWYQDDGHLSPGNNVMFHTEGFTREEVDLLVETLTARGLQAKAQPIKSRHVEERVYHVIVLTVESTYTFVELIRPYVVPEMQYKLSVQERVHEAPCAWCGSSFALQPKTTRARYKVSKFRACCGAEECVKKREEEGTAKYRATPGVREANNARGRVRYYEDVEASREKNRRVMAERYATPEGKEAVRQAKLRSRAKIQAARALTRWECQRCHLAEQRGKKDGRLLYCPGCREIVRLEISRRFEQKKKEERASKKASFARSCGPADTGSTI